MYMFVTNILDKNSDVNDIVLSMKKNSVPCGVIKVKNSDGTEGKAVIRQMDDDIFLKEMKLTNFEMNRFVSENKQIFDIIKYDPKFRVKAYGIQKN